MKKLNMKWIKYSLVGLLLTANIHLAISQEYGQVLLEQQEAVVEVIQIKENTVFKVLTTKSTGAEAYINVTYKDKTLKVRPAQLRNHDFLSGILQVIGPATITFGTRSGHFLFCSYVINELDQGNSNYASGVVSGNNATVIPDTAESATLVLEGSNDMVNWEVDTLGDKPKANRKKFYRLRVKKE